MMHLSHLSIRGTRLRLLLPRVASSSSSSSSYSSRRGVMRTMARREYTTESDRVPSREASVTVLRNSEQLKEEFDILVIGGGSVGAGAALDAASRGLKVACVEREDFGAGTSSRSTKLIWGGSRYLVEAFVALFSLDMRLLRKPVSTIKRFMSEFRMVLNCHRERKFLLVEQPHLTKWIPIAVPMTKWILWPPPFMYPPAALGPLGLFPLFFKFYDLLGGFCSPPSHIMTPTRTQRKFPQMAVAGARNKDDLKYCSVFYEGQFDDARTNLAIALTAAREGAVMANYCNVESLLQEDGDGKVRGAVIKDSITGEAFNVRAKAVLTCAGAYTDELRKKMNPNCVEAVTGAGGVHIVLPGYLAPSNFGLVDMSTSDGRFLFMLPWQGHVLVGTTDSKCPSPTMNPAPEEEEILWILNECSKYLNPEVKIRRQDVLSAWKGIRPLARDPHSTGETGDGSTASVSRDHVVSHDERTDMIFVAGGKWTTYREMAEDAIDKAIEVANLHFSRDCRTLSIDLIGKQGYSSNLPISLVQDYNIPFSVAKHLTDNYGGRAREVCSIILSDADKIHHSDKSNTEAEQQQHEAPCFALNTHSYRPVVCKLLVPGHPYIVSEVRYACRSEWARHIEDVLARRLRLLFLNKEAAKEAIPLVAEIMAEELQWSASTTQLEIQRAHEYLLGFGGSAPMTDVPQHEAGMQKKGTVRPSSGKGDSLGLQATKIEGSGAFLG